MPVGSAPSSVERQASRLLSSAQILAINSTPLELAPAPPAGSMLMVTACVYRLNYGGTAYAVNTQLRLIYHGTTQELGVSNVNFLAQTVDTINIDSQTAEWFGTDQLFSNLSGKAIDVSAETGNPTLGNGTVFVWITYYVVPLA